MQVASAAALVDCPHFTSVRIQQCGQGYRALCSSALLCSVPHIFPKSTEGDTCFRKPGIDLVIEVDCCAEGAAAIAELVPHCKFPDIYCDVWFDTLLVGAG